MRDYTVEQWGALWAFVAAADTFMDSDPTAKACQGDPSERVRTVCVTYALTIREPWRAWRKAMGSPVPEPLDPSPLSVLDCPGPHHHLELIRELDARDDMLAEAMDEVARLSRDLAHTISLMLPPDEFEEAL